MDTATTTPTTCADCGEPLTVEGSSSPEAFAANGADPAHVFCDLCGKAEHPADLTPDWNGETGNHASCERRAAPVPVAPSRRTDPDRTSLGLGVIYALGDEEIQLGIKRAGDWRAPEDREAPSGYMRRATVARGKVRAERPVTSRTLRDLAQRLAHYADVLDAWTAEHAADLEPAASTAWHEGRTTEAAAWLAANQ